MQFGFFHGAALEDPQGLLEGRGENVRHIKVRAVKDIDAAAFGALLRQAARQVRSRSQPAESQAAEEPELARNPRGSLLA